MQQGRDSPFWMIENDCCNVYKGQTYVHSIAFFVFWVLILKSNLVGSY